MDPGEDLVIPGTGLAARVHGPETGRRVLALHGWLDNAATFDALAPLLPGVRLVALDLPGHGFSAHGGPGAGYAMVDGVVEVFRAADALGWEEFSILGHSMGATIGGLAAGTIPGRVTALALVEGLAPLTTTAAAAPARLAERLAALSRPRRPPPLYRSELEALAARVAAGEFAVPEAMLGVVRRGLTAVPGGFTWRADPRLRLPSALRLTPDLAEAFLAAITAPVLLVLAKDGLPVREPAELAQQRACVRNLTVVEVEGYHHVHLDDPERVAEPIRRFLLG